MTEITFAPAEIPASGTDNLIADEAPPRTHEYACEVCGIELTYGGRGRKPTRCAEHKRNASKAGSGRAGSNEQLAAQAADTLTYANKFAGLGLIMLGLPATAESVALAQVSFRENVYQALLLDPKLCRRILTMGGKGATVGLVLAYGGMVSEIAPIALKEIKTRREAAAEVVQDGI